VLLLCGACSHNPEAEFDAVYQDFVHGNLIQAQQNSEKGYRSYFNRNSLWSWKFRLLNARTLSWRGMNEQVLSTLNSDLPMPLQNTDLDLQKQGLEGLASARLHRYSEAEDKLLLAIQRCGSTDCAVLGELLADRGFLEVEKGNFRGAEIAFEKVLELARLEHDTFLEARALLQLSYASLQQEHFDESIDWSTRAYNTAQKLGAQLILLNAVGNLGWAHYKTGDGEGALELLLQAEKRAEQLGSIGNQVAWLTAAGNVYVEQAKFAAADDLFRTALRLATQINSKEDILNAQISLAFVSVLTGKLDLARKYSEDAIVTARADGNRLDELYPLLTKGQVAARQGDPQQAEQILSEVAGDPKVNPSLKWEAQHELANLYADQHQTAKAEAAYRTTLATFETARASIQHEDVKLPFLANASSLYKDYVRFLLSQEKTAEALIVADHGRARTLAEGVGQLRKTDSVLPTALDAHGIARRAGGPILYYFLGEKQSYLWAITAQKTTLFQLPPASEIDAAVRRYRKALESPRDLGASGNPDALGLYRMLVQPAQSLLTKSSKVFIIPDGSLNALNFEALLVPDPKPHYWIEDVTIANASSLRLLERSRPSNHAGTHRLLLVGNPVAASPEYGTLPQAALEMSNIGKRFPVADQQVLAAAEATPAAYLAGKPEQFTYIHFVAHGTASRLSPLDSAIVLSKAGPADDTFRLYARDIIHSPLHADLVTISACYGAGTRAYSGEGLVGLSWAFLRAGAHNVIGALWDVSDASTPQLMDRMYAEIQRGKRPEEALRAAKLSLLHSDKAFHRPFYWAPFQFYTGS
jgi:CHAT domain-containing protein